MVVKCIEKSENRRSLLSFILTDVFIVVVVVVSFSLAIWAKEFDVFALVFKIGCLRFVCF